MNPYELIAGRQYKHAEYRNLTPERWMLLLRFFELFLVKQPIAENPNEFIEEFRVNQIELEKYESNDDYKELFYRNNGGSDSKSTNKMRSFCLNALAFLKKNPGMVTEEMRAFITIRHPKLWGWCLKQYDTVMTPGGEIVVRDETTPQPITNPTLPSVQAKMMSSLVKLADIYDTLAGSVSSHDYKSLSAVEKFKALKDLSFIFSTAAKKVTPNSFTQINISTTSIKEAEAAMLDMVNKNK